MQIHVSVCLYFLRVGGSLPHTDRKGPGGGQMFVKAIIPWFGIPVSIGSENGPAFVAEVYS
jgi:hypothetical protein